MDWKNWICMGTLCLTARIFAADFDATIPVVDMNDYYSEERHEQFIQTVYDALREVGFFAVVNTGIPTEVIAESYAVSQSFFSKSLEEKMAVCHPELHFQRGYVPGESARGQNQGDAKEFYHICRELTEEQKERLHYPDNVWPEDSHFKEAMLALYNSMTEYMIPLERAMAEALGQRLDLLSEMTAEGEVLFRASHYPASPPKDTFWAAEHTDIDLYTLLPPATAAGLQLLNKEGEWIDVRVPEGAFVVNGGDMLENLTNGEFRSCVHRVVAKEGGYERYSMVLFVHPRTPDRLDPLPDCIARTGGVQRYPNATRYQLLSERLVDLGLASPEMMKDLAESGFMETLIDLGRASPKALRKLADAGLATPAMLAELERL
ncbi:MAG: isopenicillin N synthase family oxygenase [Verrucomicrobia bacterium]|nr:isopenicillin N synthase family oxygenase [Verrucomicrobiota bacterium]